MRGITILVTTPSFMIFTKILQSIGAIFAGMLSGAVLSLATDTAIELSGLVPSFAQQFADGSPAWFLILAIVYRTIYTVLGGYISARLAPNRPMRHAVILGVIGIVANLAGTIAMLDHGQSWYPIALTILALPSTWVGGRMYIRNKARHQP